MLKTKGKLLGDKFDIKLRLEIVSNATKKNYKRRVRKRGEERRLVEG